MSLNIERIRRSTRVPYPQDAMFDLVADIEGYPSFVPWCCGARVLARLDDMVKATLEVGKGPIRKRFTTSNIMRPHQAIEIVLVDGPFRQLHGQWWFRGLEDGGSEVGLELQFELANSLLRRTFGPLFGEMSYRMVEAFSSRAKQVYGTPGS